MRTRNFLIPGFLLFLAMISHVLWTPVDGELASIKKMTPDLGLFSDKIVVGGIFLLLLPFLLMVKRPIKAIGIFPFALFGLAFVSLAWTFDIGVTIYFVITLACVFGYALAMNAAWGPGRAITIMWALSSVIILASVGLALIGDPHAIMGGIHDGDWRGLFSHKNVFAPFVVCHLFVTLFARRYVRLPMIVSVAIALGDAAVLVFAHSSTAIVCAAAGLAAGMVFMPIRNSSVRNLWRIAAVAGMILIAATALLEQDAIFELLGKDRTLSGRSVMWAQVYEMTLHHRLGTGFGTGGGSDVSFEIQKAMHRQETLGVQSGYLNLALELGWGGVAFFVAWILSSVVSTLLSPYPSSNQALFVALAVAHLLFSYSETLGCINPSWPLTVLVTALIAMRSTSPVQLLARRRTPKATVPEPAAA